MGPTTGKTVKRKGFTFQNDDGMEGGSSAEKNRSTPAFIQPPDHPTSKSNFTDEK